MSQAPSSPPSQQVPEGIEPSGIPKDHRISADQAESSAQNADTDLCPRCLSIEPKIQELLSLNFKRIRKVEHTGLEFQSADDLFRSPSCPLCQALKFICPKIWFTDQKCPARLVVTPIDNSLGYICDGDYFDEDEHKDNGGGNKRNTLHLCLTLTYTTPMFHDEGVIGIFDARNSGQSQDAIGFIAEKSALEQTPATPSANFLPALVDFKLLQEWLDSSECEKSLIEGTNPVRNLMVIDCESREIIKAPPEKYVALSYVWGQENPREGELEVKEGRLYLKRPLEKSIEDALTVTQQLNLRYLWVDRYCIPQDDFKYQISKMHEIYGGAHVTIIAAAGNGPQHGLPGVNQTVRTRPPPVTIGSRTLLATFPNPKLLVEESKWYSRGWTFQEGLLSRRRLVFTDHQVFFHCDNFIFFEAFSNFLPHGITLRHQFVSPLGPLFSFAPTSYLEQGGPWDRITQYCTLDLTNPEDTVNAILGALNYYQEGTHRPSTIVDAGDHEETTIRHITGLPISRRACWFYDSDDDDDDDDDGFISYDGDEPWEDKIISALFWKSKTPGNRRKPEKTPFPSWSWAGWKCGCYFGSSVGLDDDASKYRRSCEKARSQNGYVPSISIETEEPESILHTTEYETMFDKMHDFSKIRYLHVTALTVDARIVTYDDDGLDKRNDWWNMDNTGRKLALECSGAEMPTFLNLTSNFIYQQPMPLSGYRCLAIFLEADPRNDSPWAHLLVVGKTEDCYERIGVALIWRKTLREAHIKQKDIKLG